MLIHRQLLLTCALACATLFSSLTASSQQESANRTSPTPAGSILLEPCEVPGPNEGRKEIARCGTYEVFEDRATKSGRRIKLKIIVYSATGQNKAADPLFYIPGGPGSSATEDAPYVAQELAQIRERRDLVFVDQRGTGGSNPLNCDLFNPASLQSYLGSFFPLEDVRKCRAQLEPRANLKLYTTPIAMDDLDEVRAALGYPQINISGGSYGTRATQVYLKRHQEHVRTIVLHGVSPTNQFMPRDFPQHTERALDGVIAECAADEACRAAFPNLRAEAKTVLERSLRGPVEVDVKQPGTGKSTRVQLSRDLAGEAIRYMLYQSGAASRLPLFIHLAAQGNFTPLAESAVFYRQQIVATGSNGMYLSVTCAEDLPWIKPGEGERNAANTFLGDYRLRQQRAACALWPRAELSKDYAEPTRANVPALILTGQWDPVTPPLYGDAVAKYLPNSLHVVVPHGGHGFGGLEGLDCLQKLVADFVNRGTTKGLDTSCVNSIRRNGFLLKLAEPKKSP
ncbi:MAG: alpha/beta fold hydrolase [Pyrinomonadaceae bacterium]|nr:alpha/beta fold hydrolase [Pyrinomonadaceae bacterium]